MIVVPDYRDHRIQVNAVRADERYNAEVKVRRTLSQDKPYVDNGLLLHNELLGFFDRFDGLIGLSFEVLGDLREMSERLDPGLAIHVEESRYLIGADESVGGVVARVLFIYCGAYSKNPLAAVLGETQ